MNFDFTRAGSGWAALARGRLRMLVWTGLSALAATGCGSSWLGAPNGPLTTPKQVRDFPSAEAERAVPVRLTGVATFYHELSASLPDWRISEADSSW